MAHRSARARASTAILVVDKPIGMTSHDVVALVRRLAATKRVGHGGTLDPFATGVLPVFLGRATRVVEFHLADRKAYRATICFGASSTTDDLEGELTPAEGPGPDPRRRRGRAAGVHRADRAATAGVQRDQGRWPTRVRHGSRRRDGRAREPRRDDRAVRPASIGTTDEPDRPIAVVDVACSAGTYVRALARDLGAAARQRRLPRRAPADGGRAASRSRTRSRSTTSGRRPPTGPAGLLPLLLTDRRRAGAVRPWSSWPRARSSGREGPVRPAGSGDTGRRPITIACVDARPGALVAIASPGRTRSPRPGQGARRRRRRDGAARRR